uniref:C2H2-type domain-containing protein n=1 Tax=Glossina brevipalpis TaxID=37001 RepID=A0A1A9WXD6_9MUSC
MDLNLENLQQICRVCLEKGDVNLYDHIIKVDANAMGEEDSENSLNLTIAELMEIFINSKTDLLELNEEIPSMCLRCLEDLKFCYGFYNKLRSANSNLRYLYQECLNNVIQCIEDEQDLQDELPEEEPSCLIIEDFNYQDATEQQTPEVTTSDYLKTNKSSLALFDKASLVVTKFVPTTVENNEKKNETDWQNSDKLLTADYKVVEVNDLRNLQSLEDDEFNTKADAIYKCQYCPQAFANLEYLKSHAQKMHLCKFCTHAFNLSSDLFKHIREVHKDYKCMICRKKLSSHSNLRTHIRRVHGLKLPAKMTLIDFVRKTIKEDDDNNKMELTNS